MRFRLYAARQAWLLFPECMQASLEATHRYGPLEFIREIDARELDPRDAAAILGEIDAMTFAVLPERALERLRQDARCMEPGELA